MVFTFDSLFKHPDLQEQEKQKLQLQQQQQQEASNETSTALNEHPNSEKQSPEPQQPQQPNSSRSPSPSAFPFPVTSEETERLRTQLIYFMSQCTNNWEPGCPIARFRLFNEAIGCVFWEGRFFITGTDIVKYVSWRFKLESEPIFDQKKFEEGIFSDLRNLKPGQGAVLEEPRSKFLDFLFKLNCIRTHKKQKVFFWHSVPHEKLFQEALRREKKREINPIVDTLLSLAAPQSPPPTATITLAPGFKRKRLLESNNNNDQSSDYHSDSSEKEDAHTRKKRSPVLAISSLVDPPSPNPAADTTTAAATTTTSSQQHPILPQPSQQIQQFVYLDQQQLQQLQQMGYQIPITYTTTTQQQSPPQLPSISYPPSLAHIPEQYHSRPHTAASSSHQVSPKFLKHLNVLTPPGSESDPYSPQPSHRFHEDESVNEDQSHPASPSSDHSAETQYYSESEDHEAGDEADDDENEQLQQQQRQSSIKFTAFGKVVKFQGDLHCHSPGCGRIFRKKQHLERHSATHHRN